MFKLLSWGAVILWMLLIFNLSSQPAEQSDHLSLGITQVIINLVAKVAPDANFDMEAFNHIVRKNAHFFAYLVLGFLALNALRRSGIKSYWSPLGALIITVLYASSDEVHQIFVSGRGPSVRDVFIDSSGAGVGIVFYMLSRRVLKGKGSARVD